MSAVIADLCRAIEFNPELAAKRRERDLARLGLPADASEEELETALQQETTRQGIG